MAEETNVYRQAFREIKWLANSFKGMLALADELEDVADLEKQRNALKAEVDALKAERSNYTSVQAEVAQAKSELASLKAEHAALVARIRG